MFKLCIFAVILAIALAAPAAKEAKPEKRSIEYSHPYIAAPHIYSAPLTHSYPSFYSDYHPHVYSAPVYSPHVYSAPVYSPHAYPHIVY